jgi:hypothetical protein
LHSWVTHFYYDDEPLIFDENYERKDSYYGVRDALMTLVQGGTVGGNVLLDSDFDSEGRPWGYEWRQPDSMVGDDSQPNVAGDARPDWEQEPNVTECDHLGTMNPDLMDAFSDNSVAGPSLSDTPKALLGKLV